MPTRWHYLRIGLAHQKLGFDTSNQILLLQTIPWYLHQWDIAKDWVYHFSWLPNIESIKDRPCEKSSKNFWIFSILSIYNQILKFIVRTSSLGFATQNEQEFDLLERQFWLQATFVVEDVHIYHTISSIFNITKTYKPYFGTVKITCQINWKGL